MLNIELPKQEIQSTNVSYFSKYYDTKGYYSYLLGDGEHYKLLSWLSQQMPKHSSIIDAGTCNGHSALALAQNAEVVVNSYDIEPKPIAFKNNYPNVNFIIHDALTLPNEVVNNSSLILLDIDPHNGIMEKTFFDRLIECEYEGWLLLDDIHLNEGMEEFWRYVNLRKIGNKFLTFDVTDVGHRTGTGLVIFK